MSATKVQHLSVEERRAEGEESRGTDASVDACGVGAGRGPSDPIALLEEQNATREPDLVPVRHGRMMVSPFTFYRGAAKIMAADLKAHAEGRADGPAVRRRPPVELRRVRVARSGSCCST